MISLYLVSLKVAICCQSALQQMFGNDEGIEKNDRLRQKLVLTAHVNMFGMMVIRGSALAYGYIFHHAVSGRTCIVFNVALSDSSKF